MKKISVLFLLLFMFGLNSYLSAQTFSMNTLKGKTWRAVSGYNLSDKMDFSIYFYSTYAVFTVSAKDKSFTDVTESDYYLSDTIVKSFDRTKVGTIKSGKNIIISESKSYESKQRFSIFKIVSLTSNKLVIQSGNMGKLTITFVAD